MNVYIIIRDMTTEELKEIERAVDEVLAKRTQNVEDLPTSENLADFVTLPVLGRDGSMKTLKAELLKGPKGDAMTYDMLTQEQKKALKGEPGPKGVDGRLRIVNHGTGDTTFALTPNVMHVWGEVSGLNITLAPNTEPDVLAEYCFQFTSPAGTATVLTVTGVKWYNGFVPTVKAGKTYQASIVNGVIIMGEA